MWVPTVALVCVLAGFGLVCGDDSTYYIGMGRYDITGPSVQIEMMGYAMPAQIGRGIHLRQYSRAFIIADAEKKSRVVFINIDACMGTQIMKMKVVEKLQAKYGKTYTHENVLITGIHTHSGPAGYFQYVLFEVMSLGYVGQTLEAIVDGIVASVEMAHDNMQEGSLYVGEGQLFDANINRSPSAYLNNPADERKQYGNDTDKGMMVLKILDANKKPIGMINWFAVHCTSMNNSNRLISSDNKGLAALMMEHSMNGAGVLPGRGDFVAAFAQSNEGDVSPNTKGPHCQDTGKKCDFYHSTCNGKNELCVAFGPGKDMVESTKIIATKQYDTAKDIFDHAKKVQLTGPVKYVYTNVDFSNVTVTLPNGSKVHTCPPAMGRSFAAGTTDGPGAFNFEQGDTNSTNPFWNAVRNFLKKPSKEQLACHAPKPILLDTGEMNFPYPWQSKILPLQLFQIGQLVIIGVPAEFTTMSGRRTRAAVLEALKSNGFPNDTMVVIAGLANTYSDYVTTYEEYQVQRYEGASTAYGPYTLKAYIQEYVKLATALAKGTTVPPGPDFPNYLSRQWSLHPPILYDEGNFGAVKTDVKSTYKVGETVSVVFVAGNPRNNLMTNKTYLTVQLKDSSGQWKTLYTDSSWETRFQWEQTNLLEGHSAATITWDIPTSAAAGTYRIQHFGYHKPTTSAAKPYNGTSSEFKVTQ